MFDAEIMVVVEPVNNNLVLLDRRTSTLQQSTDPFAPREGKALVWRNVSMTLVREMMIFSRFF